MYERLLLKKYLYLYFFFHMFLLLKRDVSEHLESLTAAKLIDGGEEEECEGELMQIEEPGLDTELSHVNTGRLLKCSSGIIFIWSTDALQTEPPHM